MEDPTIGPADIATLRDFLAWAAEQNVFLTRWVDYKPVEGEETTQVLLRRYIADRIARDEARSTPSLSYNQPKE